MAGLKLKKKKKKGQLGACVSCCLPRVHSHYTFPLLFTPSPSKMKRPIDFWKFKIKKVVELLFPLNLFFIHWLQYRLKRGPRLVDISAVGFGGKIIAAANASRHTLFEKRIQTPPQRATRKRRRRGIGGD